MSSFSSIDSLLLYIEKSVEDSMTNDVSKFTTKQLKESLEDTVYSRPESDWYERTEELLNSSVSVFDDNKSTKKRKVMKVYNETNNTFMPSGHPSLWGSTQGKNQNKNIPIWMNYGTFTSGGGYGYTPTYFIDIARDRIENGIRKEFIIALTKRGFNAY